MRTWKIGVAVVCACSVAIPAFAEVNVSPKAGGKAVDNSSMKQGIMDKKTYMNELAKSFDLMDANRDGKLDGEELSGEQYMDTQNGVTYSGSDIEDSGSDSVQLGGRPYSVSDTPPPVEETKIPAGNTPSDRNKPVSPVNSIPPVNAGDLLQK